MPIIKDTLSNSDGDTVTIYIEVDTPQIPNRYYDDVRGDGTKVIEAAKDVFNQGMSLIRTCAQQVNTSMQKIDQTVRPTEFEVQFAVKLDSEVGAILAKVSTESQLQVTLRWLKKEEA